MHIFIDRLEINMNGCLGTNYYTYICSLALFIKRSRSNNTLVGISISSTHISVSKYHFQKKKPEFLEQVIYFRAKEENYKVNLEYLVLPKNEKAQKKERGACQMDPEASLKKNLNC